MNLRDRRFHFCLCADLLKIASQAFQDSLLLGCVGLLFSASAAHAEPFSSLYLGFSLTSDSAYTINGVAAPASLTCFSSCSSTMAPVGGLRIGYWFERLPWLADPSLRGRAAMAGYALAPAVADGRLTPLSIRLSAIPALLHHLRPAVCVVTGVRRGDRLVYGSTVGWGTLKRSASVSAIRASAAAMAARSRAWPSAAT